MEEDDYESLPESSTMGTHMLAGAAAGVMEHTIMYPVDCVKTRMQCLVPDPRANYRNVADALIQITRREGVKNTLRGINVMVGGAGPAHAMYFACYEKLKAVINNYAPGNKLTPGVAGVGATLLHDIVMNPADVIKQRMQVYNSPYSSCLDCGRAVLKQEGPRAFYRSFTTQLTMNIPFQSTHFVFYELSQDYYNKEREYNPYSHCISGAIAGGVASSVTTPLDVVKTLLNTQERCAVSKSNNAVTGMFQAARTIYEYRGLPGFFKGLTARVIYQAPSTAISWSVYEFFKFFITKRNSSVNCDGYVTSPVSTVQVHAVSTR